MAAVALVPALQPAMADTRVLLPAYHLDGGAAPAARARARARSRSLAAADSGPILAALLARAARPRCGCPLTSRAS